MEEIRIGTIGAVDAGKTSLTSVLVNNQLDDGRGAARLRILKLKHEKESGRTSSISEHYLPLPQNQKYLTFVDLAGHEKYLKTTMYGLAGHYIDYAIIIVGANMGISRMTQEHLILAVTLKIPFIVVITKIDMAPTNILLETIDNVKRLIKRMNQQQNITTIIKSEEEANKVQLMRICPIFCVSNKTGENIDLLRNYLFSLKSRYDWSTLKDTETNFVINAIYYVKGVGTVVSGKLVAGKIKKGDKLLLGPFYGQWKTITVKSLHDNFRNVVDHLETGESGCVAIKSKEQIQRSRIRRGMVLINKINQNAIWEFDAEIVILNKHNITIKPKYQAVINCNTIVQSAKIVKLLDENYECIRCGDISRVKFRFLFRPELVKENDRFIFREGRTKGFGKIIKIF